MSNGPLPGDEGPIRAEVRRLLEGAGRRGRALRQLVEAVGEPAGREAVERALGELAAAGEAVERDGRWLHARFVDGAVGEVDLLRSGDALIRTGARGEAGFYVRRKDLDGGMDRDTVLVRPLKGPKGRRRGDRLPEARVERVLRSGLERLVGQLERRDDSRLWLVPFDPKLELDVEVVGTAPEGAWAVVGVERGAPGSRRLRGRLLELLGDADEPGVDTTVILRHFGIPEAFPDDVATAAAELPADPGPADWRHREDLRSVVTVTIDGESARDFDDALSIEARGDGRYRVGVHIADVSHYVAEGSPLDREAYRRGTSVYFPERAVPMLPEALSNQLCSLRPETPRLTMSAFIDVAANGEVEGRRFAETVIESRRRLTYTEVRRLLDEPRSDDEAEYGEVLATLRQLRDLMERLLRRRTARGTLDFDLPEGDVVVDPDGYTVGIRPEERNVAHRIVEECMIAANEAVAWELVAADRPALFRVHDPPTRERLEELREVLKPLGIRIQEDLEQLHPRVLQRVLGQVEDRPEGPFVSNLVLRSMQQAVYSPECRGHYALASRYYTHFTSPIRRYPDLVVHRRLRAHLRGEAGSSGDGARLEDRLPAIAERSSVTERRAEAAERELVQWKKVRFLAERVGERFQGFITGVQPFGLFVELADLFVDGLVPIRTLADDFYVYDPANHRLVGQRGKRIFRLADTVEVELVGVDLRHRGLDLRIAGMPEPSERRRDRRWASHR